MNRRTGWAVLGVGAVFGFLLTASGFGDYRAIHRGVLQGGYIYSTHGVEQRSSVPLTTGPMLTAARKLPSVGVTLDTSTVAD